MLQYTAARLERRPPLLFIAIAGLAGIFGYLLIYHLRHQGAQHGHRGDFPTFYQAAQFARDHQDIYLANNDHGGGQPYVYPPLIAFLYIPFTYLSLAGAARLMLFITVAMLLASLLLGADEMLRRLTGRSTAALIAMVALIVSVLNEDQLRAVCTMLETDALMLLLFTLALRWLDRAPLRAGTALAFAFNIKYLSIVMLPYLLLRRRWSVVGAMIVGSLAFGLLPALHLGWHEDLRCLRVSTAGLLKWVGVSAPPGQAVSLFKITDELSFSLTSGIARIMAAHGHPGGQFAEIVGILALVALAVASILYRINGFPLWRSPSIGAQRLPPHPALTGIEWSILIAALLSFSPQTNARHLVLSVLVNIPIVVMVLQPACRPRHRRLFLAAILIIFFSFVLPTRKLTNLGDHYGVPGAGLLVGSLLFLAGALSELNRGTGVPRETPVLAAQK